MLFDLGSKRPGDRTTPLTQGVRAVEQLRLVMAELQVATVRAQVILSLRDDFENYTSFKPRPHHEQDLESVIDQVVRWGIALRELRTSRA